MPSNATEIIKDRLSIVDVVGSYVKLTKAGKSYKGLSPFKKEKTPSFYVSPDRGVYYDFSSGKGGDMFTFVSEMEGVDFRGALKLLAERAGVEITPEGKEARDERERLFSSVAAATSFFEETFQKVPEALEYLLKRGLKKETIAAFRIGYALPEWDALRTELKNKGYEDHELERAGLIKKGEKGSFYDRFRSRIMFPINDASGRPIAFSGRIVGTASEDPGNAKYLNSPEGPLYDKSSILFGYDKAKAPIRKYNFSILVEGQMDLVMSHQAGWGNAVAVSGTGLTERHLDLLLRLSRNVVLALDADSAGIASAERSAKLAIGKGMEVKVAALPEGMDPADLIKDDPSKWKQAIREAVPIVDFLLALHQKNERDPRKFQARVRDHILPFIALMKSSIDAAHFVKRVSEALALPMEAVWGDLKHVSVDRQEGDEVPTAEEKTISRRESLLRTLWGVALSQETAEKPFIDSLQLQEDIARISGETRAKLGERLAAARDRLIFEAEFIAEEHPGDTVLLIGELLREYQAECFRSKREDLSSAIREAEKEGNMAKIEELMKEFQTLSKNP